MYRIKVVRQEGVDGCRVAHERKVWDGWAGEVMGASLVRGGGRVCVEGNRIGEMKGLEGAVSGIDSCDADRGGSIRPIESRHLGQRVDDCVCAWPREVWGIGDRSALDVVGGVVEDEVAVGLKLSASAILLSSHIDECIPLENSPCQTQTHVTIAL